MQLIDLATISRKHFFFFVDRCNEKYRSGHDLAFYRDLIAMHRQHDGIKPLMENSEFHRLIHRTLEEWDMNKRGARLTSLDNLRDSVLFHQESIAELYSFKLYDDIYDDLTTIRKLAERVFCNLKVMESKRRIVGVSKALHFLLPDLIMPIDSKYTMTAFYGYNKYENLPKKEFADFWDIVEKTYEIAERLELRPDDADGVLWKLSVPKLIDNAIIGLWNSKKEEILALSDTE
jgi:hypothetical protein